MGLYQFALSANDYMSFAQEIQKLLRSEELKNNFMFEQYPISNFDFINNFEKKLNINFPEDLVFLYKNLGSFDFGGHEWNRLSIVSQEKWEKLLNKKNNYLQYPGFGILEGIQAYWGGRPEIQEIYSENEIQEINSKYFIFGTYVHDDNFVSYLFFTRNGEFSFIDFDQDGYYKELNSIESLKDEKFQKFTLLDIFKLFLKRSVDGILNNMN